jgi:hypothetical protein
VQREVTKAMQTPELGYRHGLRQLNEQRMLVYISRFAAAGSALGLFLRMSCLYSFGDPALYQQILRSYGVVPFQPPFVDMSFFLANWECARQGVDVILSNPCDVLHRVYTNSPLWLSTSSVPLGVSDTETVGWTLDLLFLLSLTLMPPPRCWLELILVVAATLSTTVVFALERANTDILLFMMVLATGIFTEYRLPMRLLGYSLGLVAGLLKYYPIMVLTAIFQERVSVFFVLVLAIMGVFAVFWSEYRIDIVRGLPNIPTGPYNTDLFSARNLPFLLGDAVGGAAASPPLGRVAAGGLYAVMIVVCLLFCRKLLCFGELRAVLATLAGLERVLLVIGSAVIVGCFFTAQSIGYRGVFLLMVLPGQLAISRAPVRQVRTLGLATSLVIVLLMWSECFRLALYDALEYLGLPSIIAVEIKMLFWFVRELCWWWVVSVMLAMLVDFLETSPVIRSVSSLFAFSIGPVKDQD